MKQLTRKDVLEIASLDLVSTVSIPALTLPFRDIYASPCQELRHSDAFLNGLNFSSREILCRQLRTKFRVGTLANIHLTFLLYGASPKGPLVAIYFLTVSRIAMSDFLLRDIPRRLTQALIP